MPACLTRFAIVALLGVTGALAFAQPPAATLPENVRAEFDLPYAATGNPRQRLDLYLPKDAAADAKLPLVVSIHGGGWQEGDKQAGRMLLPIVRAGQYALASVGYRFTIEAIWPAQIHGCKAAIRWLRAHAAQYGIDPARIGVAGPSAGGHLVCLLGTTAGVTPLEGTIGEHDDVDSRIACVVDQYGPTDFVDIAGANDVALGVIAKFLGGKPADVPDVARAASPLTSVTKDDTPTLCIYGTADPFVPYSQSTKLDKAYEDVGAECLVLTIADGGHGGFRNPEVNTRTMQFLDKHLRGRAATISEEPIPATPTK